jgi:hypothetical protein
VDEQSVHFEANCHRGRSVTVDQTFSGPSVWVELSLGHYVGGRSVKVLLTIPRDSKFYNILVRYHCGGWPEEVNTCFLNSYMVYF